jgi:hypothetical protein
MFTNNEENVRYWHWNKYINNLNTMSYKLYVFQYLVFRFFNGILQVGKFFNKA